MIRKIKGKWFLFSKDGSKRLGGPYTSRTQAVKRERQVEFFKHQGENEMPRGVYERKAKVERPSDRVIEAAVKHSGVKVGEAGNTQALVDSFGDWANGSHTTCVSKLEGKEGIDDPAKLCAWLKDQYEGDTSWRGEEKAKEYSGEYPAVAAYAPSGIYSFADLWTFEEGEEVVEAVKEVSQKFMQLVSNILYAPKDEVPNKSVALQNLVYEFSEAITDKSAPAEVDAQEAATIKSQVQSAVKALNSLLQNKLLPKAVASQVNGLREIFKKTWGDLEAEADGDEEGKKEEDKKDEEMKETAVEESSDEPIKVKLGESFEGEVVVSSEVLPESSAIDLDVILLKPGFGNTRDNHYYSRELLEKESSKFVGAKMYETDHKPGDKSTRTWVSTIVGQKGFTNEGAPIMRVSVHDPNFAQRIINLNEKGILGKMECSILAGAIAERAPFESDGRKGKRISQITSVESVDWVTKAGAGGHVLNIAENAEESQTGSAQSNVEIVSVGDVPLGEVISEIQTSSQGGRSVLEKEKVVVILQESSLPKVSIEKLAIAEYEDEEKVKEAITAEIDYLKAVTGSGKPFNLGESAALEEPIRISEADLSKKLDDIDHYFGIQN